MGDACGIHLLSSDGQALLPATIAQADPKAPSGARNLISTTPLPADKGLHGLVIQLGRPVRIPVKEPEALCGVIEPEWWPDLQRFGLQSILLVPLRLQGRVIGVLTSSRDRQDHPYTLDDQIFLQDLADRAAIAIEATRLYERLADRERRSRIWWGGC
jgi:GAF domain-containing protein